MIYMFVLSVMKTLKSIFITNNIMALTTSGVNAGSIPACGLVHVPL